LEGDVSTAGLSSTGRITIPKWLRERHNWQTGMEFMIIDAGGGIFLKPHTPFAPTTVAEVGGMLAFSGPAKTIEEMDEAIAQGMAEEERDQHGPGHA
jgi:AbrB family looped-hinge helix DNA binding protein